MFAAHRYGLSGVFLPVVAVLAAPYVAAAPTTVSNTVLEDRQGSLQGILDDDPPELIYSMRRQCAGGVQPDSIQKNRAFGAESLPDAADYCAAVFTRMARDGNLLQPYHELLVTLINDGTGYQTLPAAIASAVLKLGSDKVPIGHGKAAIITPALALDAGFTVAYQTSVPPAAGMPDLATLKPIAERCLGQQEHNLGLCYSIGYVYGVRAFNRLTLWGR